LFAKSILEGANRLDFNYDDTLKMICYTLIGSANMILQGGKSIDELIAMVKSPNGTTERALNVFEDENFSDIIEKAMQECTKRAIELSKI
jgi:pyrroline-5-carboxylate reductase